MHPEHATMAALPPEPVKDDTPPRGLRREKSPMRDPGVVAVGPQGLLGFLPDLRKLAAEAVEPNAFYEPAMLEPALRNLRGDSVLELVFVFAPDPNPQRPSRLIGFVPLEHLTRFNGLPVRALKVWRHRHCFLGAPLVAPGCEEDFFARLLDWAATRAPLLELRSFPGEGPLDRALVTVVRRRMTGYVMTDRLLRARMDRAASAEEYLAAAVSGRSRKEMRRQERQLVAEAGALEYQVLASESDPVPWIREFLALEAKGWKGQSGTALASRAEDHDFFVDAALAAHREGRLEMLRLVAAGKAIAMKCNFRSAAGPSFAFKIGFDEALSRFSPGVLLELENVRWAHRPGGPAWMDSCAEHGHPMIERIWSGRRSIQAITLSTGARGGEAWVAALPLLAWVKRRLRALFARGKGGDA